MYNRRVAIQTGCPIPLNEFQTGVIVCEDVNKMRKVERGLHKQFKADKTSGEWFHLTTDISEHIKTFADTESGQRFIEEDKERDLERIRDSQQSIEYKDRERERNRERSQTPERQEYHREYQRSPKFREYRRGRYQNDPKYRERQQEYSRQYYIRKKQERHLNKA